MMVTIMASAKVHSILSLCCDVESVYKQKGYLDRVSGIWLVVLPQRWCQEQFCPPKRFYWPKELLIKFNRYSIQ